MNIPIVEDNTFFDVGSGRDYRRAILNILIELNPKYCCEIGTFIYQTSHVFSYFFEKYRPDGRLITADISVWNRGNAPKNVYPVMVYPHIENITDNHGGIEIYYKDYKDKLSDGLNTVETNSQLIIDTLRNCKQKEECGCGCHNSSSIMHFMPCCDFCYKCGHRRLVNHNKYCSPPFDFCFVDADHSEISFKKDLEIIKRLVWNEGYILIDDIDSNHSEQVEVYRQLCKQNKFYEIAGMALIKNKDLILNYEK